MKAEIPIDEWDDVARRVLPFTGTDEGRWLGHVLLSADGRSRTWAATDSYSLSMLDGGPDGDVYEVLLPGRVFTAATGLGLAIGEPLTIDAPDDGRGGAITLNCGGASLRIPSPRPRPESARDIVDSQLRIQRTRARIDVGAFRAALGAARNMPSGALDDDRPPPLCHLSIGNDRLEFAVDWGDYGYTQVEIAARATQPASAAINPRLLVDLLTVVEDDELVIAFPELPHDSVVLTAGNWTGMLMPIDTTVETLRPMVEEVLAGLFGPDVVHRDHDGDYRLSTTGVPVYARLADAEPATLHVFAVALSGVEPTPELLAELNDQNARTHFVRLIAVGNQVLVESDLVAESVDQIEIRASYDRVREIADEIAPLMAMAFGGKTTERSEALRWDRYLDTVILAELSPGSATVLAGPDAVEPCPFDSSVHIITAANPQGRQLPALDNVAELGELAAALTRDGIGFVRARGESPDGTWGEDSLLTWSLDREQARAYGRFFGQEAIFEITADDVAVVACFDDTVRTRTRHTDG